MIERVSLNSLKFFYYVATFESVTIASQKLFVTQSAVSKQLKNLEENIDVELFDRTNKTLKLTENGKVLFQCCQKIFNQLDSCLVGIKQKDIEKKQLTLSCEPTFAMKWLIPRLSKFKELNHGFDIVLLTGGGVVNFKENPIDLALRRDDFLWEENIFSEKIAKEYVVMVQKFEMPLNKILLVSSSRPNLLNHLRKNSQIKQMIKDYSISEFEHFYLCLEACLAGLGSTIISAYMIEKEIEYQLLDTVIPAFSDHSAYYLLSSTSFEEDHRKMIFMEWLKQEMRDSQRNFSLVSKIIFE